jgi:serine/threonine protein kinase
VRAAIARLAARLAGRRRHRDPPSLQVADRLGPYELSAPLAAGRSTDIWRAKITGEQGFEKPIALKLLRADADAEAVRAFIQEATMAGRLYHPNIVQLVDCGQLASRTYMAMELVSGLTVAQVRARLDERSLRIPTRLLVHIALQGCEALHYAHQLTDGTERPGLVHRNLQPDNVMITALGTLKVIDFGAACLAADAAPEDPARDVQALGAMLAELCHEETPEELTRILTSARDGHYPEAAVIASDLQQVIHAHTQGLSPRAHREHSHTADLTLALLFC